MHVNDGICDIEAGALTDIPPQALRFIENTRRTDLVFLCIVDPAWHPEDEEIL